MGSSKKMDIGLYLVYIMVGERGKITQMSKYKNHNWIKTVEER